MTDNIYTIPPGISFVDSLAAGLLEQVSGDIFQLASYSIYMPTRRSCLHLRDAFLRHIKDQAAILPRIQPLGDIDDDALYFETSSLAFDLPIGLSPLRRRLLLTKLVSQRDTTLSVDQAAQLAEALGRFLDETQIMKCDLRKLDQLVTQGNLPQHWEETLLFLNIITQNWPSILKDEDAIDPVDRRNRLMEAQAHLWRQTPPPFPVIAAGSTGSLPTTASFLGTIASLPKGVVILPGVDLSLNEEAWQAITDSHPQASLKHLLETLNVSRNQVRLWRESSCNPAREKLLRETMQPAEVTDCWRRLSSQDIPVKALQGLTRCEFEHPQEEALAIALMMRETLETPGQTAALVTPDRHLAERVSALMSRWQINVNDSGGTSLLKTPVGTYLLGLLEAAAPTATSVDLLSFLKHPLSAFGLDPATCRSQTRRAEMNALRSLQPQTDLWFHDVRQSLLDLTSTWHTPLSLQERISLHIRVAETCAETLNEKGAQRLWRREDGETAAQWLDEWRSVSYDFALIRGDDYFALFFEMIRSVIVRARQNLHPRLHILGPLEARLLQTDHVIIGSLNEGIWPPEPPLDPWMSRPMRKEFGLQSPEHRIGLSAHDFVQLAAAPKVTLTRSRRANGSPTIPSRFLLQLETILKLLGYSDSRKDALASSYPWQDWIHKLDQPPHVPSPRSRPAPIPPLSARPRQLSVTEITTWLRNPYAIYAKHILRLRKLEDLDAPVDAADKGIIIHSILEIFIKTYPQQLPSNALDELLTIGRRVFDEYKQYPQVNAFWWPRFKMVAAWYVENEKQRRLQGIAPVATEAKGKIELPELSFCLRGIADRIDRQSDGRLHIIDYKTGHVPKKEEIRLGLEPQLALLALIAKEGGFENIPSATTAALAYWKLHGSRTGADEEDLKFPIEELVEEARTGLIELIKTFQDPTKAYDPIPRSRFRPRYDDYAQLARVAEWGKAGGDE